MENNEIRFEFVSRLNYYGAAEGEPDKYKLPAKGSKKAAGYDFFNPEEVTIQPHTVTYVKTGIKALFPDDMVLLLFNRSSNPKKIRVYFLIYIILWIICYSIYSYFEM